MLLVPGPVFVGVGPESRDASVTLFETAYRADLEGECQCDIGGDLVLLLHIGVII